MPEFTPSQLSAIRWERKDACVVAGPGSGKTTVLVERYRSLIEDHGFEPRQILAITFTEKAAANMKAKLAHEFRHNPVRLRDIESAWVSTIHGFCARLLREHAIAAGVDPRFIVLDAREAEEMQFDAMHRALDDITARRRAETLELIGALHVPDIARYLVDVYDAIRSSGKTIAEVRALPAPAAPVGRAGLAAQLRRHLAEWPQKTTVLQNTHRAELLEWATRLAEPGRLTFAEALALTSDRIILNKVPMPARDPLREFREALDAIVSTVVDEHTAIHRAVVFDALAAFEDLYRAKKDELRALDFNDLERRSIELLSMQPETRERVRAQFRQVMLDEFQDINEQQSQLISMVRDKDVFFAVGDVNQSIYGFRHARPDIFHEYRASIIAAEKHSAELFDNFRSREEILRTVELLTNDADGIDPRQLSAAATFLPKEASSVEAYKVMGEDRETGAGREAAWIAHRIATLRGTLELSSGDFADYRDFAVLCRNSESMGPILEAFGKWRIPFVCGRRPSFLLSRDGRDLTALLHVVLNPRDTIALGTVLRSPLVGVSDEGMLRLRLVTGSFANSLNAVTHDSARMGEFSDSDAAKLTQFAGNLKRWRAEQPVVPLEVLISRALTDCAHPFTDDLASYLHLARTRHGNLASFLRAVEGLEAAAGTESDLADADQGNCVQVMTAHAAKGLEFPVTIIAGMEKGTRRESAPVTFTPATGLGLKWRSPIDDKPLEDSWQRRNSDDLLAREKDESNRLLYVAMTRAEEHLILSYAAGDRQPSKWARIVETLPQLQVLTGDPPEPAWQEDTAGTGVEIISAPEITGRQDSTVNVTSLTVFAQCPRKYYLQRYIGWGARTSYNPGEEEEETSPPDDDPDLTAAELGTLVHDLLAGKHGEYPTEARDLAAVFLQSDLGKMAASARAEREWDFIMNVEGTLVQGVVDLWFEHSGETVIVDYKTDSKVEPAAYSTQIALYAIALQPRRTRAYLHYLRHNQTVEVPVGSEALAAARDLIHRLKTAQQSLSFDLSEGPHCHSCPFFRGLCPADLRT